MYKVKLAIAILLAILAIVVIAQNTAAMETRLLFITVTMPRALLLLMTLAVGFVLGLLFSFSTTKKKDAAT